MRSLVAMLVVAGFSLASCGESGGSGSSFDSPKALADEMGCADSYEVSESDEDAVDLNLPTFGVEEGECMIGGEMFTLSVYPSKGDTDKAITQVETIGCSFMVAFGISEFQLIRGPNWLVSIDDGDGGTPERELLEPVAERLSESLTTIECES